MIKSGAKIIDVGGESTRPGSTIDNIEWKRLKFVIEKFKKIYKNNSFNDTENQIL